MKIYMKVDVILDARRSNRKLSFLELLMKIAQYTPRHPGVSLKNLINSPPVVGKTHTRRLIHD